MAIERVGYQFLELTDSEGRRNIVRIGSIQCISDSDEMHDECFLTVANRTFLVRAPLDEVRELLSGPAPSPTR
jgi:hypothetical protein